MRIVAISTLRQFWGKHPNARSPLQTWIAVVRDAEWTSMADIRASFRSADPVDAERVIFNIGGNNYRLVVKVWFPAQTLWIKWIGPHADYDQIDVTEL